MEAQYIASIQNHVQRLHAQAQLTPVIWTVKTTNLGNPETIHLQYAHLCPDVLRRKQWRAFDKYTLVERVLQARKILGIGLMCLPQQYETQQESSKQDHLWAWQLAQQLLLHDSRVSSALRPGILQSSGTVMSG